MMYYYVITLSIVSGVYWDVFRRKCSVRRNHNYHWLLVTWPPQLVIMNVTILIGWLWPLCYVSNSLSEHSHINILVVNYWASSRSLGRQKWALRYARYASNHHKYLCLSSQVTLTLVMASLLHVSSCSILLEDIAEVVKSFTALDLGDLAPDLLQAVVTPSWCGGGGCVRPPTTSASFQFSSTGSHALGTSALALAPAGMALGLVKGLLMGNNYLECSSS